jgi:hypothetical protein
VTATISLEGLAAGIGRTVQTLREFADRDTIREYFARLGTLFPDELLPSDPALHNAFTDALDSFAGTLDDLAPLLTNFDSADSGGDSATVTLVGGQILIKIGEFVQRARDLGDALRAAAPGLPGMTQTQVDQFADDLPRLVFEFWIGDLLEIRFAELSRIASLLGLYERQTVAADPNNVTSLAFVRRKLRLDRAGRVLSDPFGVLGELYGWGQATFDGAAFFQALNDYFVRAGFRASVQSVGGGQFLSEFLALSVVTGGTTPTLQSTFPIAIPAGLDLADTFGTNTTLHLNTVGTLASSATVVLTPPATLSLLSTSGPVNFTISAGALVSPTPPDSAFNLIGQSGSSVLQVGAVNFTVEAALRWNGSAAVGEPSIRAELQNGKAVIDLSQGDGFLRSLLGGKRIEVDFEAAAKYGLSTGLTFEAGAALEIVVPLHVTFGGIQINNLHLIFPFGKPGRGVLPFDFATSIGAAFGPFAMVVDGIGLQIDVTQFGSGNLGILDLAPPSFKPPTGIGLSLDGPGGVTGGGFLSFDQTLGRYSGSIELQVFGIGVKAFGLLETKFPDGRDGFSFVVVISTEFTPVQVGFGFTLNGVGGLLGLNRSLVTDALRDAIQKGSVEHLLFPQDPVRDAPTILNDLETIYPATRDHQVVGPMAKLGWGTPTLITAELGVVIELPGPRIAVIGVAHTVLPTKEIALVKLNLAIDGVLDFPKRLFTLDASLYDSRVGSFTVAGSAAFRMSFGDTPNFVFSIGGFNPTFAAPPNFPKLRRASVDLGVNGNPSLTLSGYFALTSNTAQIGAAIRLYASGAGIELEGHVSFDALFVFSPFQFDADLDAGMSVSFHGVGIGIHFHGHLSGPSPYNVSGDVCVSILFWDACLGVSATFGESKRATLPTLDPWDVADAPPALDLVGLEEAVNDARNWSGSPPPGALSVVSLADTATDTPPIDPLGSATLRQKVVPLGQKLTRFGAFKPKKHDKFDRSSVTIGGGIAITDITPVKDKFARDTFKELSGAERLSAPPYDDMEAGFTLDPKVIHIGPTKKKQIEFQTEVVNGDTVVTSPVNYQLTQRHLRAMLLKSAAGLAGVRRTGLLKFVDPNGRLKVRLKPEGFVVADACSRARNLDVTASPTTHIQASLALEDHVLAHPEDTGRFTVVPGYELGL